MIEYKFLNLNDEIIKELMNLGREWIEEDCSYGIVIGDESDYHSPILVALDNDKIVGYLNGHPYIQEKQRSYMDVGSSCFEIDEIYVKKEYRNNNIGHKLFEIMEKEVFKDYSYISLATSTKDYKKIFHFYIDELGMEFINAFLIKKIK